MLLARCHCGSRPLHFAPRASTLAQVESQDSSEPGHTHGLRIRPWFWGLLYLPFGVSSGFVAVTLVFILSSGEAKLTDATLAGLVALNTLPHTWKFFWSPIADVTLTRKRWYLISNLISSGTVIGIALTPDRCRLHSGPAHTDLRQQPRDHRARHGGRRPDGARDAARRAWTRSRVVSGGQSRRRRHRRWYRPHPRRERVDKGRVHLDRRSHVRVHVRAQAGARGTAPRSRWQLCA